MKIDVAIRNRTAYLKDGEMPKSSEDYNATLLSIEAMEHVKKDRQGSFTILLPGETED